MTSPEGDTADVWQFSLDPYDMFDPSDDYLDAENDAADRDAYREWRDEER